MNLYKPARLSAAAQPFILRQIGGQNSALTGVREYTSNMKDAYPKSSGDSIEPEIIIDRTNRMISFRDLGVGMSLATLEYICENVGDSLKRKIGSSRVETIGEKGFGVLSYVVFGENANMTIYSRDANTSPEAYNIAHWKPDTTVHNHTVSSLPEQILPKGRTGTKVVIKSIDQNIFDRQLQPAKLAHMLSETFHPLIESGKLKLDIEFKGFDKVKRKIVVPINFDGDIVIAEDFEQQYEDKETGELSKGTGEVCIWYTPGNTKGRIRVYNKGVLVRPSISDLEEFAMSPWDSGRLDGYVVEDFLKLTLGRDTYERTTAYFSFAKNVASSYTDELTRKVDEERERLSKAEMVSIGREVMRGMDKVYRELWEEVNECGPTLFVEDKEGEYRRVTPTGEKGTGGGGGIREPIKDKKDKKPKHSHPPSGKDTFKENEKGKIKRVKPANPKLPEFNVNVEPFLGRERSLRSKLDAKHGIVIINGDHPSYLEVVDDLLRRDEYHTERITDETAIFVREELVKKHDMELNEAVEFSDRLRQEGLYYNLKNARSKHLRKRGKRK